MCCGFVAWGCARPTADSGPLAFGIWKGLGRPTRSAGASRGGRHCCRRERGRGCVRGWNGGARLHRRSGRAGAGVGGLEWSDGCSRGTTDGCVGPGGHACGCRGCGEGGGTLCPSPSRTCCHQGSSSAVRCSYGGMTPWARRVAFGWGSWRQHAGFDLAHGGGQRPSPSRCRRSGCIGAVKIWAFWCVVVGELEWERIKGV